ncbi:MAG: DUF72 domain-containing protein [bacterium]
MIKVGTCSWTEKTLISGSEFYPKDTKSAEGRLRFYAQRFSTVEVDSTYYAIPNIRNAALWAERTPDDFIFHIKAYGALTGHGINPKTLPKDIAGALPGKDRDTTSAFVKESELLRAISGRFTEALRPLERAGKLGLIVFQYPPWFHCTPSNLAAILQAKERMGGYEIGVEFRHGSWLSLRAAPSVYSFLRENNITYIPADEPQFGTFATIPFVPEVTSDTAYFRFHGRNRETWLKKGIETSLRYDYLYADKELRGFVPAVRAAQSRAKKVYAMFNNCNGSSAVRNALMLKDILGKDG